MTSLLSHPTYHHFFYQCNNAMTIIIGPQFIHLTLAFTVRTYRGVRYRNRGYSAHLKQHRENLCPVYSGTPLLWTPWGPGGVSCIQWNSIIVDTLGSWWSVLYTVELYYCGHFGDLVKCPVYSGTPLLWTPWGPGGVSCIQWNSIIVDTLGSWWSVLYTVELYYCGHFGDLVKCPVYSGTPLLWTPWEPGGVSCIQWNSIIVDTLGSWWSVLYTVELYYCGHFGDLVKCPVYSGTLLLWTLWGPGKVSCIQWNLSNVDTLGTW